MAKGHKHGNRVWWTISNYSNLPTGLDEEADLLVVQL